MTRKEAEKIIENYIDFDDETGEEYGYTIISYEGTDAYENHLFKCKADGEETDTNDYPIYTVTENKELIVIPT